MPREIKFRGYHLPPGYQKGEGDWVYGYLYDENIIKETGTGWFSNSACVEGTIGQYTGIKDKNGKEIFEGDILATDLSRPYLIVDFRNGAFVYQCHDNGQDYHDFMKPLDTESDQDEYLLVIGNIYEHPELLES